MFRSRIKQLETETLKMTSDHFAPEASIPLLSYKREDKAARSLKKYRSLTNLKGETAFNFLFCVRSKVDGSGHEQQRG